MYWASNSHCLGVLFTDPDCQQSPFLIVELTSKLTFLWKVVLRPYLGRLNNTAWIRQSISRGFQNVEEGVEASVHIYLQQLLRLIQDCNFEIFVHPVSPVLSETRAVVHIFNHVLQTRLHEAQQTSPCGKQLHWLDFFPDLLTPDGMVLSHLVSEIWVLYIHEQCNLWVSPPQLLCLNWQRRCTLCYVMCKRWHLEDVPPLYWSLCTL
jgi:hypothetical protein